MSSQHSEQVTSVVKALGLLQVFSPDVPRVTIARAAAMTGMTRPSARRILLTCVSQEFMATDGKEFWLTPKVMRLGFSYLSTLPFWETAQPHLRELADLVEDSCSMATLDGLDIVYLMRIPKRRGVITLNVGSRLPAHATSLGKVLLAFSPEHAIDTFLEHAPFEALTEFTITEPGALRAELATVREQGYATSDGEREVGVRSAAAPVLARDGRALAAVNVSGNSVRISHARLVDEYVPPLVRAAREISSDIGYSGLV